jgi:hypothetical protein
MATAPKITSQDWRAKCTAQPLPKLPDGRVLEGKDDSMYDPAAQLNQAIHAKARR